MPHLVPEKQRRFAVEVVEELRAAGFAAYWAGGCVRDQLLGYAQGLRRGHRRHAGGNSRAIRPSAHAGHRRGLRRDHGARADRAGQVEVTTFRRDAAYSDGRHPDASPSARPRTSPAPRLHHQRPVLRSGGRPGDRLRRRAGRSGRGSFGDRRPPRAFTKTSCGCCGRSALRRMFGFKLDAATDVRSVKWPPISRWSAPSGSPRRSGSCSCTRAAPGPCACLTRRSCCRRLLPEVGGVGSREVRVSLPGALASLEATLALLEHLVEPTFAFVLAVLLHGVWKTDLRP